MRAASWCRVASVVVGTSALLVAACGTAEESQSTSTSATTGVSSSTTSTSSASTSTTAASTSSASLPATTSVPIGDELVLRSDGVGPFGFGTDMDIDPTACGSRLSLAAWELSSDADDTTVALPTELGVFVGSTVDELTAAVPSAVLFAWNDSTFYPPGFYVPSEPGEQPMIGLLDWDWISDLQRALNEQGAHLAVDGEAGPRTKAAFAEFRDRGGHPDSVAAILALGLAPDGGAHVTLLAAGNWFWEFECGTLEPLESC